ncbi:MAG: VCBS repeat-containing protein [Deltaproteobacteria bacterium]|nr:VCBS repeat-containing protein [Deltaproteobacteria bacterium]
MARQSRFRNTHRRVTAPLVWIALSTVPALAQESGVSPSRVKLPTGPGSIGGVGEDADVDTNMGIMGYGVSIGVPPGHAPASTPSLRLAYNTGAGASVVGIGWTLGVPAAQRMTSRGLPRYTAADLVDLGGELVKLPGGSTYRNRYESAFSRHTWVGAGSAGYWKSEYADGTVAYFGATAEGVARPDALVTGPAGEVFRWHLVDTIDKHGHAVHYEYIKDGTTSLLSRITYVFVNGQPQYEVLLSYEDRPDLISDGKPGFLVEISKRLVEIKVMAAGQQRSRYRLEYEDNAAGLSRLARVLTYSLSNTSADKIRLNFRYTGSVLQAGQQCVGPDCRLPYVETMAGPVGVDFRTRNADLVDLNGDALPDVLDTTGGTHRVSLNDLSTGGGHRFRTAVDSTVAGSGVALSNPHLQLVDLDGDGFTDLLDAINRRVLWNRGTGDWDHASPADDSLPDFELQGASLRFFDYDGDKKIDVMFSDPGQTFYYLNRGDGTYETTGTVADAIGWGFQADQMRLADMNGDGMQDAVVRVADDGLLVRTYLGRGRWAPVSNLSGDLSQAPDDFYLMDLNGDGLSDLVFVLADSVKYLLNKNSRQFDTLVTLTSSALASGAIPDSTDKAVRLADMDGNGSTDIVWIDASGSVTYLEMFPMRPNLLNRVDNSIGKVIEADHGSSTEHMARDGGPLAWNNRMPFPMLTLNRLVTRDSIAGSQQVNIYRYHNAWYDGREKQFRGFADVETVVEGDPSQHAGRTTQHYEIGRADTYRKGLLTDVTREDNGVVMYSTHYEYADCPVAGIPTGTEPAVRYICQTARVDTSREGRPAEEGVVREMHYEYDGCGNQVKSSSLGITSVGGGACEACTRGDTEMGQPCGNTCLGDETYIETTYIPPPSNGKWLLHLSPSQKVYSRPGSNIYSETRNYFDGEAFVGLPLGQATLGDLVRVERRLDADHWMQLARNKLDADGSIVETLDANGHRRRMEYTANGLWVSAETLVFDDPTHDPYELRLEVTMDPVTGYPVESSGWMLASNGAPTTPPHITRYLYDASARLVNVVMPGDTDAAPTYTYQYDIGDDVVPSRVVMRQRTTESGPADLETITCMDGTGRAYQRRTKIAQGAYHVDGYVLYNGRGMERRLYQGYRATTASCDRQAPAGVPFAENTYDALGRILTTTRPDGELYGTPSVIRTQYWPRYVAVWDEADNDPESTSYDSPTVSWMDGLGRKYKEVSNHGSPQAITTWYAYDELNQPLRMSDSTGITKRQVADFLGHPTSTTDPDMGTDETRYDVAGNMIWHRDALGDVAITTYDEMNRITATWAEADPDGTRITYTYDRKPGCTTDCERYLGRLVSVSYPTVGELGRTTAMDTFDYDAHNRLAAYHRTLDGHTFDFADVRDRAGRVTGKAYPGGRTLAWTLDGLGRRTAVAGFANSVAYESGRTLDGMVLGNGVTLTYDFDVLSRPLGITARTRGGTLLQSLTYEHDRAGNVLSVVDALSGQGTPSGESRFAFDARNNLVSAVLDPGTPFEETVNYSYDLLGNITSKTSNLSVASREHVGSYAYGERGAGPHAATRAGDVTLDYDARGHVMRKGLDTYDWDAFGRLVGANRGNRRLADYAYDGMNVRVRRRDPVADSYYLQPDFEVRDGVSQLFVEAGGRRVALVESITLAADLYSDLAPAADGGAALAPQPDHAITAADAWLAHAAGDGILALTAGTHVSPERVLLRSAARRLLLTDDNGAPADRTTYLLQDYQGSVTVTLDEQANVVQHTEYFPLGTERFQSAGYREPHGFKGLETEDSSELTYISPRYRDQRLAVWLSPNWAFFNFDPATPAEERPVYAQNVQNPLRQEVATGRPPPARAVQHVARGSLQISGGASPPAPVRREILSAAASSPHVNRDPVKTHPTTHLADSWRLLPPMVTRMVESSPPKVPTDKPCKDCGFRLIVEWETVHHPARPPKTHDEPYTITVSVERKIPDPPREVQTTIAGLACNNGGAAIRVTHPDGTTTSLAFSPTGHAREGFSMVPSRDALVAQASAAAHAKDPSQSLEWWAGRIGQSMGNAPVAASDKAYTSAVDSGRLPQLGDPITNSIPSNTFHLVQEDVRLDATRTVVDDPGAPGWSETRMAGFSSQSWCK